MNSTDRLILAMHEKPGPWSPSEVGECMGIREHSVHSYLNKALADGRIIRHSGGRGNTTFTLGTGLVGLKSGPKRDGETNGVPVELSIPKFGSYCPPQMTPPRGAHTEVRAVSKPPAGMCTGCSRAECWDHGCQKAVEAAAVPNPPAPPPAPAVAPPDEPQEQEQPQPEDAEADPFDCWLSGTTGELLLIGLEPDEDGRITLTREQVATVRGLVAWARP